MPIPRKARGRPRPRLTGVSVLLAGVSWDWTESERDAIRDMIIALEDRRALSDPHSREYSPHVIESIMEIRTLLTLTLQRLPEDAKSAVLVRDMRTACHAFLNRVGGQAWMSPEFSEQLGELRGVFGMNLSVLADKFGIEVHGPLATILPPTAAQDDAKWIEMPGDAPA
jgi:hypothetical protein